MKLIILNGPSGVGKSTLAARFHEQMPQSALIEVDALRREMSDYREKRKESLEFAYTRTAEEIEKNLKAGRDAIVDKNILDADVLDMLTATAKKCGAGVYEFLLFAEKESVQNRADARGYRPGGLLTPEKVGVHWERQDALRAQRASAMIIDTTNLNPNEVFDIVSRQVLP